MKQFACCPLFALIKPSLAGHNLTYRMITTTLSVCLSVSSVVPILSSLLQSSHYVAPYQHGQRLHALDPRQDLSIRGYIRRVYVDADGKIHLQYVVVTITDRAILISQTRSSSPSSP